MLSECVWSPDKLSDFVAEWKRNPNPLGDQFIGDNPLNEFVATQSTHYWDDFLEWVDDLEASWCFRGQRESAWTLHTSLDRAVKREFRVVDGTFLSEGYFHVDRSIAERGFLSHFRRHSDSRKGTPRREDRLSWLALMQHSGIPTPCLDWTYSPYVALYFALEKELEDESSAVWSIDLDWLEKKANELLSVEFPSIASCFDPTSDELKVLLSAEKPVIVRINPPRANKRIIAQKALLLRKLLPQATFGQHLMSMMIRPEIPNRPVVRKLIVRREARRDFLDRLNALDICRESLFPELGT